MPAKPRNHAIDLARALSIVVVVVFHSLLYQVRLVDGAPVVVPWAAPLFLYPLTWVLMIMPLFFVAGGFSNALISDRRAAEGSSYGHYLANRGRRLVGPLITFVVVCALLASGFAWAGWVDAAASLSRQFMQLLWFITVYLAIVAAAPLLVRAHDRFGVWVMVVFAVLALAVDAWSFAAGRWELRNLNMAIVWPLVHQFGIAYERGWFRRGPLWTPWAAIAAGSAGVAVLVFRFGYPPTSVGFADLPIANVQPPTFAMACLALAQCGVLAVVERSGRLDHIGPGFARVIGTANALAMTIYLWHIPCIVIAGAVLLAGAYALPAASGVLLFQLTVGALALVVVSLLVPLIARVDLALIPALGEKQDAALAVTAYGFLLVGTLLVWQFGTVVHPGQVWSSVGVVAVLVGYWLMRRASGVRVSAG